MHKYTLISLLLIVACVVIAMALYYYPMTSETPALSRIDTIISRDVTDDVAQEEYIRTFSPMKALLITDSDAVSLNQSRSSQNETGKISISPEPSQAKYGGLFKRVENKVVFVAHVPCDHQCPPEKIGYELTKVLPDRFVVYRESFTHNERSATPGKVTFTETEFGKDDANVYFHNRKIEGADPDTFEIFAGPYGEATKYSRDKNYVFFESTILSGENPETFQVPN